MKFSSMAWRRNRWVNLALAGAGILVILSYIFCRDSCRFVSGSLMGVDLKYTGLVYLAGFIFLVLLAAREPVFFYLAAGVGGEAFLLGYQLIYNRYCPFCLSLAVVVLALFLINFEGKFWKPGLGLMAGGFLLFSLAFASHPTPAYGSQTEPGFVAPIFGKGAMEVRLYTDYFCIPCQETEEAIEPVLTELVAREAIRLILIDTPLHQETALYARFFVGTLAEDRPFEEVLRLRRDLFLAARQKITDPEELRAFIRERKVPFNDPDFDQTAAFFNVHLTEDEIDSTPTLVVIRKNGDKEVFKGKREIVEALRKVAMS
ncbi:MAG: thioredoxin domain-containing protein [Deltaproteobacteria bacterium]|nr:thioredoxin domain-containing protein [Deltaproteobacteria bacterium]